ncbi:unnamed protein product [Cylindrotheca closterium]|uniref:Uncharacterized protein n=1 Tax=Cylindrotheca closterium TaxID=2856 RepID=A0AAD2G2V8_9STRA|nr:unnamed protein product [Cylindrotheca closterium]
MEKRHARPIYLDDSSSSSSSSPSSKSSSASIPSNPSISISRPSNPSISISAPSRSSQDENEDENEVEILKSLYAQGGDDDSFLVSESSETEVHVNEQVQQEQKQQDDDDDSAAALRGYTDDDMDGSDQDDMVVIVDSSDRSETQDSREEESFDAIGGTKDILEEGMEVMEETLEELVESATKTEPMEDQGDDLALNSHSMDAVVGEFEVSELNQLDAAEEPVLIREDEVTNVLGVQDGTGQSFFSKLFGH